METETKKKCPCCQGSGLIVLTLPKWRRDGPPLVLGTRLGLCECDASTAKRYMAQPHSRVPTEPGGFDLMNAKHLLQCWADETIWAHYDVLRLTGMTENQCRVVYDQLRMATHLGVTVPDAAWPKVTQVTREEIRAVTQRIGNAMGEEPAAPTSDYTTEPGPWPRNLTPSPTHGSRR